MQLVQLHGIIDIGALFSTGVGVGACAGFTTGRCSTSRSLRLLAFCFRAFLGGGAGAGSSTVSSDSQPDSSASVSELACDGMSFFLAGGVFFDAGGCEVTVAGTAAGENIASARARLRSCPQIGHPHVALSWVELPVPAAPLLATELP